MMLSRGMRGDAVESVQLLLRRAGAYPGRIDGWYGPQTEAAVKNWQGFVDAKRDGMFGPDTSRRSLNLIGALNPDLTLETVIPGVPDGSV